MKRVRSLESCSTTNFLRQYRPIDELKCTSALCQRRKNTVIAQTLTNLLALDETSVDVQLFNKVRRDRQLMGTVAEHEESLVSVARHILSYVDYTKHELPTAGPRALDPFPSREAQHSARVVHDIEVACGIVEDKDFNVIGYDSATPLYTALSKYLLALDQVNPSEIRKKLIRLVAQTVDPW